MRIVVCPFTHTLLPLAHRLQVEGNDVEVHPSKEHFRAAYRGIISGRGTKDWEQAVEEGEALLITDDSRVTDRFEHAPRVLGQIPPAGVEKNDLGLAGWWDGQELLGAHWSIIERGAWPGGIGKRVNSSVTLIHAVPNVPLVALAQETLASAAPATFRGVVRLEVTEGGAGLGVTRYGWPDLSHQVWAAGQQSATLFVEGKVESPRGVEFGTVVSVPPWPNPPTKASRPLPLGDLPSEVRKHLIFHDVELKRGKLQTAGLDGLIAVATARARFLRSARTMALQAAAQIQLHELQARSDAGELGETALVVLESQGWI